jgi:FkbM family methyltransferase
MVMSVNSFPDWVLRFGTGLPWPANRLAFSISRRAFARMGRWNGALTRIRFGNVEIIAPLAHPAVYWRYRPVGFNMNYVSLVRSTLKVRSGLIIDVGANIGDGIALLRGAGINVQILGVEGTDLYFNLLERNIADLEKVNIEKVYLGSHMGDKGIAVDIHDGTANLTDASASIETIPLDELMLKYAEERVVLLKSDTDGFDAKVLEGATGVLANWEPVVFVELDDALLRQQGGSFESLLDLLVAANYRYVAVWDNNGRWLGARDITESLSDWIACHPGGFGRPYLDIAAFKERDRAILDDVMAAH